MRLWFIFVLSIIASIGISVFAYNTYVMKEVQRLGMDMLIGEKIGINIDGDAVHFGTTFPGGGAKREVLFYNKYDHPIALSISIYGDIAPYVSVSRNNFIIAPGIREPVMFIASTPHDIAFGNYTGYALAYFKRA